MGENTANNSINAILVASNLRVVIEMIMQKFTRFTLKVNKPILI
jgi:hypothetical protein